MADYQALAASEAALREELRSVKAQVGPQLDMPGRHTVQSFLRGCLVGDAASELASAPCKLICVNLPQ